MTSTTPDLTADHARQLDAEILRLADEATLGTTNFCCPKYISDMLARIHRNRARDKRADGLATIKYTIRRTDLITNIEIPQSSGDAGLDAASRDALVRTQFLAPLPAAFSDPELSLLRSLLLAHCD